MDIGAASSSDDSDSDDYDDEDAHGYKQEDKETRAEERRRAIKNEDNITKGWGRSKNDYYSTETAEFELMGSDEENVAQDEEEESSRLQKERAKELEEDDFGFDSTMEAMVGGGDKKGRKDSKSKKGKSAELDLDDIDFDDDMMTSNGSVEKIAKDLSHLTENEKLQIVLTDSPELLGLLEEFKAKLDELRNHIQPVLKKVQENNVPTSKGISLLELKFHLLLNYCTNITFYLLLKAEGKSIKGHPVVKQLVHIRTILEKIRPLETKLKYQIDKLLKTAAAGNQRTKKSANGKDLLSFKPNPSNFADDDEDDMQGRGFGAGDAGDDDGVYRPPRLTATSFEDDERAKDKAAREKQRLKERVSKSSLMQSLQAEFSERPEKVHAFANMSEKADDEDVDRSKYEEENFLRLADTKSLKKKRKARQRMGAFEDFDDFNDLEQLAKGSDLSAFGFEQKKEKMADRLRREVLEKHKRRAMKVDDDVMDDDMMASAMKTYKSEERHSKKRKKDRKDAYPKNEYTYGETDPTLLEEGSQRPVGRDIMKNRGLTRYRNKDLKNPRKKNRLKYEKALIKRRSTVQEFKGKKMGGAYGGEQSGIKKTLTRSVRL